MALNEPEMSISCVDYSRETWQPKCTKNERNAVKINIYYIYLYTLAL